MIDYTLILWLLFIHWIADFIFQPDWMAKGKSKNNWILTQHAATYGLIVGIAMGSLIYGVVNGLIHWCVDYATSRWNARMYAQGKIHEFFVGIGFDQWLHAVTLILTLRLLGI